MQHGHSFYCDKFRGWFMDLDLHGNERHQRCMLCTPRQFNSYTNADSYTNPGTYTNPCSYTYTNS